MIASPALLAVLHFLALEPDDELTDRNRFVIRKALLEAVANQCTESGAC